MVTNGQGLVVECVRDALEEMWNTDGTMRPEFRERLEAKNGDCPHGYWRKWCQACGSATRAREALAAKSPNGEQEL